MKVFPVLCFLLLPLAAAAAPVLDLERLASLEQEWQLQRAAHEHYHINQRTRRFRDGTDDPWREDTFIRIGSTLYQGWFSEHRPERVHETVVEERDGKFISYRGKRVIAYDFGAVKGGGLGSVLLENARGATLLAGPPGNDTWMFIIHMPKSDDHYTVDPATGAVLRREARIARGGEGEVTSIAIRDFIPLDRQEADRRIHAVMMQASASQQQLHAEAQAARAHNALADAFACAFLLVILGVGARAALSTIPNRRARHWLPLTAVIAALIIASYFAMEHVMQGWYTMLLAVIADLPLGLFNISGALDTSALIVTHSAIFGALWLTIAALIVRTATWWGRRRNP